MSKFLRNVSCLRSMGVGALWLALLITAATGSRAQQADATGGSRGSYVWAWGDNESGQLGNGTLNNSVIPVPVVGQNGVGVLGGIVQIASYSTQNESSVALDSNGNVWAWGGNNWGELGHTPGTNGDIPGSGTPPINNYYNPIPVQVIDPSDPSGYLSGVTQVAAGGQNYYVAIKSDGSVWAWGNNSNGELGHAPGTDGDISGFNPTPIEVMGPNGSGPLTGITQIAFGGNCNMAIKSDGTVWAWGYNVNGQLGNGTTNDSYTPVQVVGPNGVGYLTGITQILGGATFLALKNDGTVWAWGSNWLGNGTSNSSSTPVQVVGPNGVGYLTGITQLAASLANYALKNDGTVWAWGDGTNGDLGNGEGGPNYSPSTVPVQVVSPDGKGFLTNIVQIVGADIGIALRADGAVFCWGNNGDGSLGNGLGEPGVYSSTPVQVVGPGGTGYLTGIIAVQAQTDSIYARAEDGTVWAWGYNNDGELDDGTTTNRNAPVQAIGLTKNVSLTPCPSGFVMALSGTQLVWQNSQTGDTYQWLLNGAKLVGSSTILNNIASDWKMVATADFTSNGMTDILWQNASTGEIGYWQMNGGRFVNYVQIAAPGFVPPATGWQIVGAGNLSGNATLPNILFRNTKTGEIGYWTLSSQGKFASYTQVAPPGFVPPASAWQLVATAQFSATGAQSLVWQNTSTGEIGYWRLAAGKYAGYVQIAPAGYVPTAWHIAATPDVNGDGQSDLVWQNVSTGEVGYWLMSNGQRIGTNYTQLAAPSVVGVEWQVRGSL